MSSFFNVLLWEIKISGGEIIMLKRKLSTLILAATITNLAAAPANVFAETLANNT